ncbi:MAG TPA: S4 domain-containing protein, partial [Solirubrobacteraceae bacterium]|nr:S4 domain-containing protein [Solirubrobacteraceae bacterium]
MRLDTLLAERGLFDSRTRAAASVMAGEVRLGGAGERAQKPGQMVDPDIALAVDERPRFVS